MGPYCYFDGAVIPLAEAKVRPDDLGMLRGFAVYEGISADKNSIPFRFSDHWQRLERSAGALGMTIPHTESEVYDAAVTVCQKNAPGVRASIRLILSGGPAVGGIEYDPTHSLLYLLAEPTTILPHTTYEQGASLITREHLRFMPEYKTTAYIPAVGFQNARKAAGAIEVLYTHEGRVLECATSNIFIVKEGRLITAHKDILPGITREVVLELAKDLYPVEERTVSIEEFMAADEVFITSSFKDIVPIVLVDGVTVGGGVPGSITKDLMHRFETSAESSRTSPNTLTSSV